MKSQDSFKIQFPLQPISTNMSNNLKANKSKLLTNFAFFLITYVLADKNSKPKKLRNSLSRNFTDP